MKSRSRGVLCLGLARPVLIDIEAIDMIEIRRVLCPIDFSEHARRGLAHAVVIAKWYGSTITVLHVFSIVRPTGYVPDTRMVELIALTPDDRKRLVSEVQRFVNADSPPDVPIEVLVSEGDTAGEILRQATALPADLLVLGTHGRSGFRRLLLGSVTEKVLRQASCPVLSVPRGAGDAQPAPPVVFKRILCAVDFSDCSLKGLSFALSLAQEADAHLLVVHVMELPHELAEPLGFAQLNLDAYRTGYERESLARLNDAIPDTVRAYCRVETQVLAGKPYREILHAADAHHSELIVMGIHGRGAVDLMLFGSTTQHVVRQASCPVLTLRTA